MADDSNPFATPTERSNVALVVEDKKLHVSKEYLAVHSPVFDRMFFGEFAEKGKEEVEIKGVKYEKFVGLLNVIHPGYTPITATSVSHILKLADQFQMKGALEQCEAFLLKTGKFGLEKKLSLADQYNLLKLREQCEQQLMRVDDPSMSIAEKLLVGIKYKMDAVVANCVDSVSCINQLSDLHKSPAIPDATKVAIYNKMIALLYDDCCWCNRRQHK